MGTLDRLTQLADDQVMRASVQVDAAQRWWHRFARHPMASAVVLASAARLATAVGSFILNPVRLIPDEVQYVTLARSVGAGRTADSWAPTYGQKLYDSTWAFMAPLVQLFKIFGSSRLVGQLYVCVVGVLVVAGGVRVLRGVASDGWALVGGIALALLPSQVVFSSVVLREAHVWVSLAVVIAGAAKMTESGPRPLALGACVCAVGLLLLGNLRDQTLLAAAWALPVSMALVRRPGAVARTVTALALAALVPLAVGLGPGGWTLLHKSVQSLARTRTVLAVDANSAYTATTLALPTTTEPADVPGGENQSLPSTTVATRERRVRAGDGRTYIVDESMSADVKAIPRGLVANMFRPFPWEPTQSLSSRLARVENVAWYVLYVFAVIGLVTGVREAKRRDLLLYPAALIAAVVIVAALTQGNLGTAFRHRQQIALPVIMFAVVGASSVWDRRTWRA